MEKYIYWNAAIAQKVKEKQKCIQDTTQNTGMLKFFCVTFTDAMEKMAPFFHNIVGLLEQ